MPIKFQFIYVLGLIFCLSCSSKKQAIDPNMPAWAQNIVSTPGYYSGVGYAPKVKGSDAHYQMASDKALGALSSEISVSVSSNTVLVTLEDDKEIREDISSVIHARSSISIDGYEKIGSYENKKGYWVYYRLSKELHAQNELIKKDDATKIAVRKFKIAHEAEVNGDFKLAIAAYAEAIDAIIQYINDPIEAVVEGRSYEIISESHRRINTILNHIQLETSSPQISCKFGEKLLEDQMYCVTSYDNKVVKNLPIEISYTGDLSSVTQLTDEYGKVSKPIHIRSERKEERVEFSINKNELLKEAKVDYAIRKWILKMPTPKVEVKLVIAKPSIYITSSLNRLMQALKTPLVDRNYPIESNSSRADYTVSLTTSTSRMINNGIYTITLDGVLMVKSKSGAIIYSKALSPIKGMHINYQEALNKAYQTIEQQILNYHYKEVLAAIKGAK